MKLKKEFIMLIFFLFFFALITLFVVKIDVLPKLELKIINFVQSFLQSIPLVIPRTFTNLIYGNFREIVVVFVLLMFLFYKKYKDAFVFVLSIFFAEKIYSFIKPIIARPRPPVDIHLIDVTNYSFPSGHSTMSMVFFGILIYFVHKYIKNRILKITLISILSFLILLIGFTRIWLGVHYPTDVLGGFSLGICCILIFVIIDKINFSLIFNKLKNKE